MVSAPEVLPAPDSHSLLRHLETDDDADAVGLREDHPNLQALRAACGGSKTSARMPTSNCVCAAAYWPPLVEAANLVVRCVPDLILGVVTRGRVGLVPHVPEGRQVCLVHASVAAPSTQTDAQPHTSSQCSTSRVLL